MNVVIRDTFDFDTDNPSAIENLLGFIGMMLFTPFEWESNFSFQLEIPYCNCDETGDIPASFLTEAIDAPVAPTCTESGLTEGRHCCVCGKIHAEQEVVPALGHNEVEDKALEPTCAENGFTEGSHCSRCGKVFVAQQNIPALGHIWDDDFDKDCGRCGEIRTARGDANGDGIITSRDATEVIQYIIGTLGDKTLDASSADFNKDGKISSRDVTAILKYLTA